MELLGYSERGFINALLYEIAYRDDASEAQGLVADLFSLINWPATRPPTELFASCQKMIVLATL